MLEELKRIAEAPGFLALDRAPEGFDALVAAQTAQRRAGATVFIARDDRRAEATAGAARFFAPELEIVSLPAWDCQPYDRISPSPSVAAARTQALARLAARDKAGEDRPVLVVTTVAAALQRAAPRDVLAADGFIARVGEDSSFDALTHYLARNGYVRVTQVAEPGDYALRGGVADIWPPGYDDPIRLDFFGDTLEKARIFAPDTQKSVGERSEARLAPVSECPLDADSIARFRRGFVAAFGAVTDSDPVYEAVSAGARAHGLEHWLPLFHERLESVFDYVGADALFFLDHLAERAVEERLESIADYYAARRDAAEMDQGSLSALAYRALEPDKLYLSEAEWTAGLMAARRRAFSTVAETADERAVIDLGARPGRDFAPERQSESANVFDAAASHIKALSQTGKRVVLACWTEGSRERTAGVLADHGVGEMTMIEDWSGLSSLAKNAAAGAVLALERGIETDDFAIISEQDILGDRLARPRKKRRAANFIAEASALSPSDLVVHVDHGIGRYLGLKTLEVQGAAHDCLEIEYAGGTRLFLPVENIELLSRYGADSATAQLDKLGGVAWQSRKAKAKQRLRDLAEKLIAIAAARAVRETEPIIAPSGAFQEFCARFPYVETDDQLSAIDDVLTDIGSGKPMDRLICGDVGFGKTEVALRAAFAAAIEGRQVALVCPTTLLARQHFKTFSERMKGWPINVRMLSRLASAKDAAETREALANGRCEVVIGTHAVLAKTVNFKDLALLIIDEEQHFGVRHKERLKELKSSVQVLTLTATPIPRTLQMSLAGIRELSIIATPPVDRLAVRTFVTPMDPVTVREALLRERYRGGQSFYVAPRIKDLPEAEEFLRERVPEVSYVVAHGQMSPSQLEDVMNAFYDGRYDVLLSTPIVESGLDIPTANTLIVHRSDMFGLSQLYQLRGRVGRSKTRAYAYLTIPANWNITPSAKRRLEVLQSLDTLGAGFTLASHDLDMRGGGNLLGEEQSGHIRDVGVELFHHMLEEAVASLRDLPDAQRDGDWSPQINVGVTALIPEDYVPDLDLRLALYRRAGALETDAEREGFAAELIDRFGALPSEAANFLKIVEIKALCRATGVAKIDAGPKGGVLTFRENAVSDPTPLIELMARKPSRYKLRPDETVLAKGAWDDPHERIAGALAALREVKEAIAAPSASAPA